MNKTKSRMRAGIVVMTLALVSASGHAAYLEGLGHLDGGIDASYAAAVSADGSVVTGYAFGPSGPEVFRWTRTGGMIGLGALIPGGTSEGAAISSDGSIIVGTSDSASGKQAFRWTEAQGMVSLNDLSGTPPRSEAYAISSNGLVVAGYQGNAFQEQASRWIDGKRPPESLGVPPHASDDVISYAHAASADGSVLAGHFLSNTYSDAFRWTESDGMVPLTNHRDRMYFGGRVGAMSADGSVLVGSADGPYGREAFRWTSEGGTVGLGDLPGNFFVSEAYGTSGDGSIVVGKGFSELGVEAFVWTSGTGMLPLRAYLAELGVDVTGWHLYQANAISSDGTTIVGYGVSPAGRGAAFIANISAVPEPSTLALALVGGVLLVGQFRASRKR